MTPEQAADIADIAQVQQRYGLALDEKGRKIWRRFNKNAEGSWTAAGEGQPGHSLADFYLASLEKFSKHWKLHPHSNFMVGAGSPHDYESTGCTVCHQGRGWSTDFGRAYHTPDLVRVDDWLSDERVAGEGWKLPLSARMGFGEAMQTAHAGPDPANVGYVTDRATEKRWKRQLGRSKGKLKYWTWPQFPKSLVQTACLKCHKEGLYSPPEPEYPHMTFGKPVPLPADLDDALLIFGDQSETWRNRDVAKEADRMLIPASVQGTEEPYRPESLLRGMDGFLRFGCYGCHKLDAKIYPFMNEVRPKVGPPLDTIATKTTERFVRQQIWNPKNFRPNTRMPRFFGQSNNSHDFRYRFADPDTEFDDVNGPTWSQGEVYAMARWLWTEAKKRSPQYPPVDLSKGDPKRGQQLLVADANTSDGRAKACIACHEIPIQDEALKYDPARLESWVDPRTGEVFGWSERMSRRFGPNLAGIGSKLTPEWLVAWLLDPKGLWHDSNMPDLRLTEQDALDIAAYLMTLRNAEFEALPDVVGNQGFILKMAEELKVGEQSMPIPQAVAEAQAMTPAERTLYVGKKLVKHYGCFGCHDIDVYKKETPIGTELTDWGSKLIERLEWNHFPIDHHKADFPVARFSFAYAKLRNPRIFDLGMPRANRPFDRLKMGNFGFSAEEARDISTFLVALVNDPVQTAAAFHLSERDRLIWKGRQIVRNANCQACHVIEGEGGDVWQTIKKDKWRPPDLRGQGIKTKPEWLFKFFREPSTIRPWFSIHMPTFGFTEEQNRAVVAYFAALSEAAYPFEYRAPDSLADADGKPMPLPAPKTLKLKDPNDPEKKIEVVVKDRVEEARMLFREYSCKSCHSTDPSVPPENRAPNFLLTRGGRLRVPWVRKWLWNPGKLQQGTAMPAFYDKRGNPQDKQFFDGDSAKQIRALADFVRYHYKESDK